MKAEVKSIISPDILDLRKFEPRNKEICSFLLELVIGPRENESGDIFSVEVVTPKWLIENNRKDDVLFIRSTLIVFEYDIEKIINEITIRVESISGESWPEIVKQLSKFANWEFEDYKSYNK